MGGRDVLAQKKAAEPNSAAFGSSRPGTSVLAETFGEDDARERTIQCLAPEILHLHAGLARDLLPDLHRRLRNGNPCLLSALSMDQPEYCLLFSF